ncbi:MAG: transglutaminase family protein [Candidatus Bipolaricaulota bacterium]|nr:MAG: transglutaminase family protein [Candidatus Bipolaricaulota bacterium]
MAIGAEAVFRRRGSARRCLQSAYWHRVCATAVVLLLFAAGSARTHSTDSPSSELYLLEGSFRQRTEYLYELTLAPDGGWLEADVYMVPQIEQPWYRVHVERQELSASFPWLSTSYDENRHGRGWTSLRWQDPPDEVVVTRSVDAISEAIYGPITVSDPFPVERSALPSLAVRGLESTDQIQADDPTVRAIADAAVSGCRTQLEAVVRVLAYVRAELRYACGKELCEPVYRVDGLYTLQRGIGNCVCYANAALALLRAAGIPSIDASGFVADREESYAAHAWIAVFFPSQGWIEFESSDWMPAYHEAPVTFLMPQHISIHAGEMPGITRAEFSEAHRASFEVLQRPEVRTTSEATVSAGTSVAWVGTLVNGSHEACTMTLTLEGAPAGWYGALSESRVSFDPDGDPSDSVDILVTIIPAAEAAPGDVGTIAVSAERGGAAVGRIELRVTIGP